MQLVDDCNNLGIYYTMKRYLRVLTVNLCHECPAKKTTLINKWIKHLTKVKGDVLFLQEVAAYNLEKLATELGLKILNINNSEGTCVLINPYKLSIVDNNVVTLKTDNSPIYIGGMHLDDIPSVPHHMNNMTYNSSVIVPLSYSLDQVLKLCAKRRMPRVKAEMEQAKKYKRAIIAGDFNEPSHLDLNINTPVSKEFEKNKFVDTYRDFRPPFTINYDTGYTWPAGVLYKTGPLQRIDIIYTKNLKTVDSYVYEGEGGAKWISDHKMVVADLEV